MAIFDVFPVLSWLHIFWFAFTFGFGIAGVIVVNWPKFIFLGDLVKYGKSQSTERSLFHRCIELPKKWFTHFYILSTTVTSSVFVYVFTCYYFGAQPGPQVKKFVRFMAAPNQKATVSEFAVMLTFACLLVHSIRRLFESLFVSVYSNTKMNILHYITGWLHYCLIPLTILAEAPGFVTATQKPIKMELTITQGIGLLVFAYASYEQDRCLAMLASMRRNYLGNITNYAHGIPVTGWFDLVSCPHFLFEILVYISLYGTLNGTHRLWILVVMFVVINQVSAALITHNWYKEKYKHRYPVSRTALVPYLL